MPAVKEVLRTGILLEGGMNSKERIVKNRTNRDESVQDGVGVGFEAWHGWQMEESKVAL